MLKNHEPIFGKNVIETLSEGMYDNPLFLFREYVQNAADAIDAAASAGLMDQSDGQIQISIDSDSRQLVFEDNGIGIPAREVPSRLANIGASKKDRIKNKGFRGIGRLGGLGYCKTVRFETSAYGENVRSVLEWDAEELHRILADSAEEIDAGELIKRITTIRAEHEKKDAHYFKVSLLEVNKTSDDLLDVEDVRRYLSMVAPVPFDYSKFRHVDAIEDFLKTEGIPFPIAYQVYVNGEEVRKGYAATLEIEGSGKVVETLSVVCRVLKGTDSEILGWYWFCVSKFEGFLPKACWQRCIRLRKSNIQIGEADCLSNHPKRGQALWQEDRGNNYFMGEIYALDPGLIPNSRRDYFNQDEACRRFELALAKEFSGLHKLYHDASAIRSSVQAVQKAEAEVKSFNDKDRAHSFFDGKERDAAARRVQDSIIKAEKAQTALARMKKAMPSDAPSATVLQAYEGELPKKVGEISQSEFKGGGGHGFVKDKISTGTWRVLNKVFKVIECVLPPSESQPLKDAIKKEFERK